MGSDPPIITIMKARRMRPLLLSAALLICIGGVTWLVSGKHISGSSGGSGILEGTLARFRASERIPKTTAEERKRRSASIAIGAQQWYERLLEKYPEMKPVYRDVPDEQNGYLQFMRFAESADGPRLPDELMEMILGRGPIWDAGKFKAWLAENKEYADEILRIAELPDRSSKGFPMNILGGKSRNLGSEFTSILRASSRLAFESGDPEAALRYMAASLKMGDHLTDIETPTMLGEVIATSVRSHARDLFQEQMLPSLAQNPEALQQWKAVLFREEPPSAEYARVLIGEWNTSVRDHLLPALLGEWAFQSSKPFVLPDPDALIDLYTATIRKGAADVASLGPDRFAVPGPESNSSNSTLDAESAKILKELLFGYRGLVEGIGNQATETAMHSAVISILRGEQPVADPVSGKAFQWDPATRTLSPPEGHDDGLESIKLP